MTVAPDVVSWVERELDRAGAVEPPLRLERIGAGQSNLTYRVTDVAGRRWILRMPPFGELLDSAHDVERECRIMAALGAGPVPVPGVIATRSAGAAGEPAAALVEHVDGVVIDDLAAARALTPHGRRAVSTAMVDALLAIRRIDPDTVGLGDLGSRGPYAHRQLRRWTRQWEGSRRHDIPLVTELARRLGNAAPQTPAAHLVHGDLHLRNVLVDPDTCALSAVLDWELSTLGDPMADLGTLLAYWPRPGDPETVLFQATRLDGFLSRDEILAAYAQDVDVDVRTVGFWHALALWKLAIIVDGVLRRTADDSRNRGRGIDRSESSVEDLLEFANDVAHSFGM